MSWRHFLNYLDWYYHEVLQAPVEQVVVETELYPEIIFANDIQNFEVKNLSKVYDWLING